MSNQTLVGIGEIAISTDPDSILVAPNLGSCLGISIYDSKLKIGGLIHCLLPLSKSDLVKAKEKPCTYVDTGVTHLLEILFAKGAKKQDLNLVVAGGASINDQNNVFEIGKKNITVLRKILWKNDILIKAQDVEANYSRTISLHVGSGEVWLKTHLEQRKLL